jgi:hypothetical protein
MSPGEERVDPGECGPSLLVSPAASLLTQARSTTAEMCPDAVAVDENTTDGGDLRKEGWLAFGVLETDDLYATAGRCGELGLEVDDAIEARIT